MIKNYLNRKNSLRILPDHEFDSIVEQLAEELIDVNYTYSYSDHELHRDWTELCQYDTTSTKSASTILALDAL